MNIRTGKKVPFLALLIVAAMSLLAAQTHVLTGNVTDAESRQPLPGATIRILGGTLGTVANAKGEYRFSLPAGGTVRRQASSDISPIPRRSIFPRTGRPRSVFSPIRCRWRR